MTVDCREAKEKREHKGKARCRQHVRQDPGGQGNIPASIRSTGYKRGRKEVQQKQAVQLTLVQELRGLILTEDSCRDPFLLSTGPWNAKTGMQIKTTTQVYIPTRNA